MTTDADIQALAGKLREFARTLSEPEQALLEQLLERAMSLSDEELLGVAGGASNLGQLEPKSPLSSSLQDGGPAAKLRRM